MRAWIAVPAVALAAIAILAVACGDGPGTTAVGNGPSRTTSSTAAASVTGAAGSATSGTSSAAWPGPSPKIGGNVTAITPAHGAKVTQASTRTKDPRLPQGVCFTASFAGIEQGNGRWFRLIVDQNEVTPELTWILTSTNNPTGGKACYAPPAGLSVGQHTAAVGVQNPDNPNEPPRQSVAWKFEVTN